MSAPESNVFKQAKLNEVIDNVNEKLASLRERERILLDNVRRNKKTVDYMVDDELAAMAGADTPPSFSPQKMFPPKPEKIRRDKVPELSFGNVPSFKKILKTAANSPEEKFRLLDARDKMYQSARNKQASKGCKLVGTCPDMCPEKERLRRFYQAQLSPFEMVDFPKNTEMKEEWMVKEYARSSADQDTPLPHDLRPVPVLEKTMLHLCRNIADRCEFDDQMLEEWYMYLWDRTRAIRKDITQQDVCDPAAARLLEQCARFHIHCADRLAGQDLSIFDDKINTENLTKCLQTLKYMYNDLASVGVDCPNAPEFWCYSLLLNLNNPAIMTEVRDMPDHFLFSEPIRFALNIISARETNNYCRFFKLVEKTTYLNSCLLRRYFSEMRRDAIETIVRGFCPKGTKTTTMSVLTIANLLLYEDINECIEHLNMCNLSIKEQGGYPLVILNRRTYEPPETAFPVPLSQKFIQGKREVLTSEIIWGSPLPADLAEPYPLQNSFNDWGELKPESINDELLVCETEKKFEEPDMYIIGEEEEEDEAIDEGLEELSEQPEGPFLTRNTVPFAFTQRGTSFGEEPPKVGSRLVSSTAGIFATSPTNKPFTFGSTNLQSQPTTAFTFSSLFNSSGQTAPAAPLTMPEPNLNNEFLKKPAFSFAFSYEDKEQLQREKEENERKERELQELEVSRKKEEERLRLELEYARKMQEEKIRLEREYAERREVERIKAAEDRRKKEVEEKKRRESELAEEKRKEEERRKLEAKRVEERKRKDKQVEMERDRQRVLAKEKEISEQKRLREKRDKYMQSLRKKYSNWKLRNIANQWRKKARAATEARRLKLYRERLRKIYPPVCPPALVDGTPLVKFIPNSLILKRRNERDMQRPPNYNRNMPQGPPPTLPLVHIGRAVAPSLKERVRTLYPDPISPFRSIFPWKLVLSIPDAEESDVTLDTFIEMHFVDHFDWKFGVEAGPLIECVHRIDGLELHIIVRRVKGCKCYEGAAINPDAAVGANSILFFLTDSVNSLPVALQRLNKLRSTPGGCEIPIVVYVFGDRLPESKIRTVLGLGESSKIVICSGSSQESLVTTLSESLSLAAGATGPIPLLRAARLDSLLKTSCLDLPWQRVDRVIYTHDILLNEPEPLVNYYNECINELSSLFLSPKLEAQPRVAPEFESILSRIEEPLQIRSVPKRDKSYCKELKMHLDLLKLPEWPCGAIKTTQMLNYKLHQYGKVLVRGDKLALKHLKWRIYRIIQRRLLWKGLDIYCDDDIRIVLVRFPWVEVFQDFARVLIEQFIASKKEFTVMYNKDDLNSFYWKSSLVDALLRSAADETELDMEVDLDATKTHPEYEDVVLAYRAAVERKIAEEEIERKLVDSFNIGYAVEAAEAALSLTAKSPADLPDLKRGFEELNGKLSDVEEILKKRRIELEELMTDMDSFNGNIAKD